MSRNTGPAARQKVSAIAVRRRPLLRSTGLPLTGLFALALLALGGACSSGGGGAIDAGYDTTLDFSFGDLPPGCPPNAANEKGVGAPCTRMGNECTNNLVCTCDTLLGVTPPADTPCFCTVLGFACPDPPDPNYCGTNATCCAYMTNGGSLCVPNVCIESGMCPDLSGGL